MNTLKTHLGTLTMGSVVSVTGVELAPNTLLLAPLTYSILSLRCTQEISFQMNKHVTIPLYDLEQRLNYS